MADTAHSTAPTMNPHSPIEAIREEETEQAPEPSNVSLASPDISPMHEKPGHDFSTHKEHKRDAPSSILEEEVEIDEEREEREKEKGDNDEDDAKDEDGGEVEHTPSHARDIWKFHMRPAEDDEEETWWFASTAIPLLAATTGPLANVLSIAALVTSWRETYDPAFPGVDDSAIPYPDPHWCINLNIASLVCGFLGNLFLLFNFTRRVRYIVALPTTIILWYIAGGILIGITLKMNAEVPPVAPDQIYSQGYWHAVMAATFYMLTAMALMVNMLGYALGHYQQHFELNEEQQNLILQTMMFFFWLAAGGGIFSRLAGWSYCDALYFSDVTVLTVGFGDFSAPNDVARGIVFPYAVFGIIMLGLMVSSINKFAAEMAQVHVVREHVESRRVRTVERAVSSSEELKRREILENALDRARTGKGQRPQISAPFNPEKRTITFNGDLDNGDDRSDARSHVLETVPENEELQKKSSRVENLTLKPLKRTVTMLSSIATIRTRGSGRRRSRRERLIILREEKDRFDAMRAIQDDAKRFRRYYSLAVSILVFSILWCIGAMVFYFAEQQSQQLSYFEALYFCYVSLLTIGYGDLAPKSNIGKPFFVVWSLIAVPTMTILISNLGDTVVASYKQGTFALADWTVLPRQGIVRDFLDKHPKLLATVKSWIEKRASAKRVAEGFPVGLDDDPEAQISSQEKRSRSRSRSPIDNDNFLANARGMTLEQLADEDLDEHDLAKRLAVAIRRTADHIKHGHGARYTYEEWVEYTRLIRFSNYAVEEEEEEEEQATGNGASASSSSSGKVPKKPTSAAKRLSDREDLDGIIEWDWIGSDSPMMSGQTETEWILDRLCESLDRYMEHQLPSHVKLRQKEKKRRESMSSAAVAPPAATATGISPPAGPDMELPQFRARPRASRDRERDRPPSINARGSVGAQSASRSPVAKRGSVDGSLSGSLRRGSASSVTGDGSARSRSRPRRGHKGHWDRRWSIAPSN